MVFWGGGGGALGLGNGVSWLMRFLVSFCSFFWGGGVIRLLTFGTCMVLSVHEG